MFAVTLEESHGQMLKTINLLLIAHICLILLKLSRKVAVADNEMKIREGKRSQEMLLKVFNCPTSTEVFLFWRSV